VGAAICRQRVFQLTAKSDIPAPIAVLGNGKVWAYDDVKAYAQRNGRVVRPITQR
jgi:hypothetical protein